MINKKAEAFAKLLQMPEGTKPPSFPRRRESILEYDNLLNRKGFLNAKMDSRLRGNDGGFGFYWWFMRFYKSLRPSENYELSPNSWTS
ncbi:MULTISPECIES: hypothetical protein [Neisseria]|uniref:hypothetical protein n=1 Tax=Neisseria TaxID=482 RepID=UPI0012FE2E0D|nr:MULTISPECIES: hypothetical protein [Neisseria]